MPHRPARVPHSAVLAALVLALCASNAGAAVFPPTNLTVGVILDWDATSSTHEYFTAIQVSLRMINEKRIVIPGLENTKLNYNYTRPSGSATNAQKIIQNMRTYKQVSAVVGPVANSLVGPNAITAAALGQILMPPVADAAGLTNKQANGYTTLFRPFLPSTAASSPILSLMLKMGWKNVAILYAQGSVGQGNNDYFTSLVNVFGLNLRSQQNYVIGQPLADWRNLKLQMQAIKNSGARIIVSLTDATAVDFPGIKRAAQEFGLFGNGYIWLTQSEAYSFVQASAGDWPGLIVPVVVPANTNTTFRNAVNAAWGQWTSNYSPRTVDSTWWDSGDGVPTQPAGYAVDCVFTIAKAWGKMILAGYDPSDGNNTWLAREFIRNATGMEDDAQLYWGPAAFDSLTQDRLPTFNYVNIQNGVPVSIGKWLSTNPHEQWALDNMAWPTGPYSGNETSRNVSAPSDGNVAWAPTSVVRGDTISAQFERTGVLQLYVFNSFGERIELKPQNEYAELSIRVQPAEYDLEEGKAFSVPIARVVEEVYEASLNTSLPPQRTVGSYIVSYTLKSQGLLEPGSYLMVIEIGGTRVPGSPFALTVRYPDGFLRIDHELKPSPEYAFQVLAAAPALFGAWTGLSFLDQALSLGDHGQRTQLAYLLIGGASMGLGHWGATLVSLASVGLPSVITFEPANVMGAVAIPVALSCALLYVLLTFTRSRTRTKVTRLEVQIGNTHSEVENKHVTHRIRTWQMVLSGLMLSAVSLVTCVLVYAGLSTECRVTLNPATAAGGVVVSFALALVAPWVFFKFFTSPARLISPIIYAASMVFVPYLSLTGVTYEYVGTDGGGDTLAGRWGPTTVKYIGSFTAVFVALILLLLSVTRLRMSKEELLRMVKLMQVKLDDTRAQLMTERAAVLELRALMHLTALVRPQSRADHFALLRYLAFELKSSDEGNGVGLGVSGVSGKYGVVGGNIDSSVTGGDAHFLAQQMGQNNNTGAPGGRSEC